MATVVTSLTDLYRELGGTKDIPLNATTTDILGLIAEEKGYEGEIPLNPVISDIVKFITAVVSIPDTTLAAFSKETIFDYQTTDLQSNISVASNGIVTGTLKYLADGALVDTHGEGNFIAVECQDIPNDVTNIKLGMYPTFRAGEYHYDDSGLQDITTDPDKGGAFKVTNKDIQSLKIVTTDGSRIHSQLFPLRELVCLPAEN